MTSKTAIARNVAWNWAGMAAHMLSMFLVFPFLVHQLGQSLYGLWALIASLTGYLDVLDLGLRASLGRNVAFQRAKGDQDGVNGVVSTGLALLVRGAAAVLLVTAVSVPAFFWLFEIPEGVNPAYVRLGLVLIGVNLALIFLFSVFEGVLWGYQRFDLSNGIDIPAVLLRVGLTFWLVGGDDFSLVTLGLILIGVTLLRGAAMALCTFRVDPALRIGRQFVRPETRRELLSFGVWCFLLSVANVVRLQVGPFLIGNRIRDLALIARFGAASRLVHTVNQVLVVSTGVLTPLATALHAEEKKAQQQWLLLYGGRACMALALFFFCSFLFLGEPFLFLWMSPQPGRPLPYDPTLLTVLMLGELLPLSQWVTYSTVIGMNRHRLWATMEVVEVGLVIVLALALLPSLGLLGICLALAVSAAVCRGAVQLVYGCRILGVPLGKYVAGAVLLPVLAAAVPTAFLAGLTQWHRPGTWAELFAYGLLYAAVYAASAALVLVGPGQLRAFAALALRRFRTPAPEETAGECRLEATSAPNG